MTYDGTTSRPRPILAALFALCVLQLALQGLAQDSIIGTWSSGSQAVQTGPGFANPQSFSFTYPKTSGISYSFDQNGHFEEALYRFNGNATVPKCIQGVVIWQHGKYSLLNNGSILLEPIAADGRIQVQDMCAARSNFIQQYNQTELFSKYQIFQDRTFGPKLHLFRYDGAPFAPMFQVSTTPIMLPTYQLTNVTDDQ